MVYMDLNLSDHLSLPNNDTLSLGQTIKLLTRQHNEQVAKQVIRTYCLETPIESIQRVGMEFLYINGYYDDLEHLIIKNKQSLNNLNHKWADLYQILLDRRLKRNKSHVYLKRLKAIQTDDIDLKCLIEFTKIALFFDQNQFGKIGNLLAKQPELFDQIEDEYILSSCELRLYQQLFVYYWGKNELIMARKYAFRALNVTNNARTKSSLHTNLGLTYTFDTYQQAMYHLNEALKIARENGLDDLSDSIVQRNIPFISAHFGMIEGISSTEKSEQAHIEIAKGNNDKAIHMLESITIDTPFKQYYLGLAKHDEYILQQAYTGFIKGRSDFFFSRLPFNAIQKIRR